MIKLDYTNVTNRVIGDNGLDITQCFNEYAPRIQEIINATTIDKEGNQVSFYPH